METAGQASTARLLGGAAAGGARGAESGGGGVDALSSTHYSDSELAGVIEDKSTVDNLLRPADRDTRLLHATMLPQLKVVVYVRMAGAARTAAISARRGKRQQRRGFVMVDAVRGSLADVRTEIEHEDLPVPRPYVFLVDFADGVQSVSVDDEVQVMVDELNPPGRVVSAIAMMIRTEDELNRNVGESQSLLRFLSQRLQAWALGMGGDGLTDRRTHWLVRARHDCAAQVLMHEEFGEVWYRTGTERAEQSSRHARPATVRGAHRSPRPSGAVPVDTIAADVAACTRIQAAQRGRVAREQVARLRGGAPGVSNLCGPFWLRFTYAAPVLVTKY
jgi:hypothetical protein